MKKTEGHIASWWLIDSSVGYLSGTLSAWQTKTDTYADSVDLDEIAHNKSSHKELHCLLVCFGF